MGRILPPRPVKLIVGIISVSEQAFLEAEKFLLKKFGPLDYKSRAIPFNFTDYYEKEMGINLIRYFVSFRRLIDPARLSGIKIITNRLEEILSKKIKGAKRPVNIDPGYITDSKLVLASTKNFSHRIYLGKGIYAELTLYYHNGSFKSLEWTYPDYKTESYLEAFNNIRTLLIQQKKAANI